MTAVFALQPIPNQGARARGDLVSVAQSRMGWFLANFYRRAVCIAHQQRAKVCGVIDVVVRALGQPDRCPFVAAYGVVILTYRPTAESLP